VRFGRGNVASQQVLPRAPSTVSRFSARVQVSRHARPRKQAQRTQHGDQSTAKTAAAPTRPRSSACATHTGALRGGGAIGLGRGTNLKHRDVAALGDLDPHRIAAPGGSLVVGRQYLAKPARLGPHDGVFLGSKDGARSNTAKAIEYSLSSPCSPAVSYPPGSAAMLSAARTGQILAFPGCAPARRRRLRPKLEGWRSW